jgi:hypothetical protein
MAIIETTLIVKYNANGGTGTPASQTHNAIGNAYPIYNTITLSSTVPTRSGYYFMGWADTSTGDVKYHPGGTYTYVFTGSTSTTKTFYAVWGYRITYNKGSQGTGDNKTQNKPAGSSVKLKGAIFTRTNYTQVGWSRTDGGAQAYALGATYSADANITLYPVWKGSNSTIASLSSSVNIGSTGSLSITRYNSNYLHRVEFTFGSYEQVYNSVGTSLSFTIPSDWLYGLPTSTSAVATCTVKTFEGSTLIGSSVSKTFTIKVPDTAKPSVSLTATYQSSNPAVNGWGILVQNYSTITLTASATAPTGTTIDTITFSGDGVSQSGATASATSSVLKNYGSREWTCTVKDKRGRTTTVKHTATVYQYRKPAITNVYAERALSDGTESPAEGTYIKARATYSVASCSGNNSATVKKIEYKIHTDTSWSSGQANAASNTAYTFGNGEIAILNNYDVLVTVTDAVGNTSTYLVIVSSVKGVSFGLNGECARFGGPVQYDDRFECDWDTVIHGDLTVDGSINGIGETQSTTPDSSSLANNSWVGKASLTFSPGVYVLEGGCRFAANANGYRAVVLASANNSSTILTRGARTVTPAINDVAVVATFTMIREFTEQTTLYVNAYQNSGSALTVYPWFRSVKIY